MVREFQAPGRTTLCSSTRFGEASLAPPTSALNEPRRRRMTVGQLREAFASGPRAMIDAPPSEGEAQKRLRQPPNWEAPPPSEKNKASAIAFGTIEARSGMQDDGGVASELLSFDLPVRHESGAGVVADGEMEWRARDGLEQAARDSGSAPGPTWRSTFEAPNRGQEDGAVLDREARLAGELIGAGVAAGKEGWGEGELDAVAIRPDTVERHVAGRRAGAAVVPINAQLAGARGPDGHPHANARADRRGRSEGGGHGGIEGEAGSNGKGQGGTVLVPADGGRLIKVEVEVEAIGGKRVNVLRERADQARALALAAGVHAGTLVPP